MSLQDLIAEIEQIGEKKLKDLDEQFEKDLKTLAEKNKKDREVAVARMEKKATEASERVSARTDMLANTERKKQVLSKKREIMESVFIDALSNLATSPSYKKYLESSLKQAEKEVKEGIIIPAKGKKSVTEEAIAETSYKIGEEGKFHGGFILKTGKVEYDFTFDSMIEKTLRDELETKVANILF